MSHDQTIPPQVPSLHEDLVTVQDFIKEWSDRHCPRIQYFQLLTTISDPKVDPYHHEIDDEDKSFDDSPGKTLITFVDHEPSQQTLRRYGIDGTRDLILQTPVVQLIEVDLAEYSDPADRISPPIVHAQIGDRFRFDDTIYEVLTVKRTQYWANSNIPLWIVMTADKVRVVSVDFPQIVPPGSQ